MKKITSSFVKRISCGGDRSLQQGVSSRYRRHHYDQILPAVEDSLHSPLLHVKHLAGTRGKHHE